MRIICVLSELCYSRLNVTTTSVRSGLKGFLIKLSGEAQDEMRCFILKTVVHKV